MFKMKYLYLYFVIITLFIVQVLSCDKVEYHTITKTITVTSTSCISSTPTSIPECTTSGGTCDLNNPGNCCNLVCVNGNPHPTCY